MSRSGATVRALPALLKIGFAEAVAYRAEMFIWILSTTMPIIMLAIWSAVARDAPVGRFGQAEFTAYFLATFVVRQATGAWVAWELNYEVRHGTLAVRLLRPIHPLVSYAAENVAALPVRLVVALPVAAIGLVLVGRDRLAADPAIWGLWAVAMLGAWLIAFFMSTCIGSLAFFLDSSIKVVELWLVLFLVCSGYLIPIALFPPALRAVLDWLPFRYQLGLPVELMTGAYALPEALAIVGRQWAYVAVLAVATQLLWRSGLRRFAAFGG